MKKNYLKIIAVVLLCWMAVEANAQITSEETGYFSSKSRPVQQDFNAKWSVGMKMGPNWTSISQSNLGRNDETYSSLLGLDPGIQVRYAFTDWLAIRADLSFMTRFYRMDRNLHYLDPVYTKHKNAFITLPIMADFSFGGKRLQGHAYCGGYGAYWLFAEREGKTYWMTDYYVYFDDFKEQREFNSEDQRIIAGAVGGLGLSYSFLGIVGKRDVISIDVLYYYDLVSHHKGYAHLSDPRYLNTLSITLGLAFSF